ncbi:MAG: MarR family winged helix-turn-helix transcriptional regulator [Desulfobacterales bacterium]|nr:MarR family winged helix-turn-helix transcriptional regulator [Desulfobacterales bacterium]
MKPYDDRLIFLIGQARHSLFTHLDRVLVKRAGVTTAQAGVLFYLMADDGCLLLALSRGMQLDKSAITRMTARLERKGLIERRPCPRDGRAVRVFLTAAGRRAGEACLSRVKTTNTAIKENFWPSEIESFSRVLQTIIQRFTEEER